MRSFGRWSLVGSSWLLLACASPRPLVEAEAAPRPVVSPSPTISAASATSAIAPVPLPVAVPSFGLAVQARPAGLPSVAALADETIVHGAGLVLRIEGNVAKQRVEDLRGLPRDVLEASFARMYGPRFSRAYLGVSFPYEPDPLVVMQGVPIHAPQDIFRGDGDAGFVRLPIPTRRYSGEAPELERGVRGAMFAEIHNQQGAASVYTHFAGPSDDLGVDLPWGLPDGGHWGSGTSLQGAAFWVGVDRKEALAARWRLGEKIPETFVLPSGFSVRLLDGAVEMRSAELAFVMGVDQTRPEHPVPSAALFEGGRWTLEAGPAGATLVSFCVAADHTRWAIAQAGAGDPKLSRKVPERPTGTPCRFPRAPVRSPWPATTRARPG